MNDEKTKPSYWAVLPAKVRYDEELTASAKLLYAEISSLTEQAGYCFAKNEYFLELFGISERTLQRLLKSLEARGFVRIEDGEGGAGRRKIYAGINPLANPDKNDGVTPTKMTGNPDKNDGDNIIKKKNKKENNPPIAPQGAGADYVPKEAPDWKPERFAAFWKFYPLHKSKQAAIKAWDKLKPSDELLAVIGKALRRQIAEEQEKARRRKQPYEWKTYASTYLNGARWTDEDAETPPAVEPAPSGRRDIQWL